MFQKYVKVNKRDLRKAIEAGITPMETFFDANHGNLPYFGNLLTEPGFGNSHHSSFSMAHIPGRWLNGLLSAQAALGVKVNEEAITHLRNWAYKAMEAVDVGFGACIDVNTVEILREVDLHNLRESMHGYYALVKYRKDDRAYQLAMKLIDMVDRYFDYDKGVFKEEEWGRENQAKCQHWGETHLSPSPFPLTAGRYIGPLVKFYMATGETKALKQAIRLKNTCFNLVLNEKGDYNVEIFGTHTHSTTATISSLAQLGHVLNDHEIFARVDAFMQNGLKQIAIKTGWCLEGDRRKDDVGEINNTSDIMETCLILGAHGYKGYYAWAEQILRAHFLPSQLLDTHFVPQYRNKEDIATYCLDQLAIGAFGFPCPYGHEYEPGAPISFNWDIVGGGVGGLCQAYTSAVTVADDELSINLLFDMENDKLLFKNPYDGEGNATLTALCDLTSVRIRVPRRCKKVTCAQKTVFQEGEWAYLGPVEKNETVSLVFDFQNEVTYESFRGKTFTYQWEGEEVIAMHSKGKRLCFFPEI